MAVINKLNGICCNLLAILQLLLSSEGFLWLAQHQAAILILCAPELINIQKVAYTELSELCIAASVSAD